MMASAPGLMQTDPDPDQFFTGYGRRDAFDPNRLEGYTIDTEYIAVDKKQRGQPAHPDP